LQPIKSIDVPCLLGALSDSIAISKRLHGFCILSSDKMQSITSFIQLRVLHVLETGYILKESFTKYYRKILERHF